MAQIYLREIRTKVDERFVGIRPRGNKLKPVHMAGGEFRALIGKVYDTEKIKRLSYVVNAKGITPIGNELEDVYNMLTDDDAIESGIRKEDLETLRKAMQDILGADNGVFYNNNSRVRDGMVSFSAGSHFFVTGKGTYEENGEFIAELIKKSCPDLAEYVTKILEDAKDPISLLFSPVCSDDVLNDNYVGYNLDEFELFKNETDKLMSFMESIKRSGDCLLCNFRQNQNYLGQLRMFNFFCIFVLLRYMSMLEAFYCTDGKVRPILADFTSKAGTRLSSVSNASMMSYTLIHSSIARFYAWAYAQELNDYPIEELFESPCPKYDSSKTRQMAELEQMWEVAIDEAKDAESDDEKRNIFGKYIYDMLALESDTSPVNFMKGIGVRGGLLYPLDPQHPHKRFVFSQDIVELMIRCCVKPGDIISCNELRTRLWDNLGIVIGGSITDIQHLETNGMILQVDSDSLEENFASFTSMLQDMNFAELLADGILQIRLNKSSYDA